MSTSAETDPRAGHARRLDPPPAALVEDGRYRFGSYDGPIALINPLDVAGTSGWGARVRRAARDLRMKEWEAFQLGNDEWFVLGAVYNAKLIALLQVLAVHKQTGRIHRWEKKVPPTEVSVARGLDGTRSHGRTKAPGGEGEFSVAIGNDVSEGRLTVDASHPGRADRGSGSLPALELHGVGDCGPQQAAHQVICHPFSHDRALYSDKVMMPFAGTLRIGDELIELEQQSSFMILDDHHGEYPSPMVYDWVTGIRNEGGADDGPGSDGRGIVGFNLTDNQVRAPERFNENAVWIGTRVHRLPAVHFERPDGVHGRWRVRNAAAGAGGGRIDVGFTPTVRSEMHVGPRHALAEYYAPYGWFDGSITTAEGLVIELDGFFGVGEQKHMRL